MHHTVRVLPVDMFLDGWSFQKDFKKRKNIIYVATKRHVNRQQGNFSYTNKNPPLTIMKITLLFMFHVPTPFLFPFHLHNSTIREKVIIIRVIPVLMYENRSEELKEYIRVSGKWCENPRVACKQSSKRKGVENPRVCFLCTRQSLSFYVNSHANGPVTIYSRTNINMQSQDLFTFPVYTLSVYSLGYPILLCASMLCKQAFSLIENVIICLEFLINHVP